jgi:acyl carrier protein
MDRAEALSTIEKTLSDILDRYPLNLTEQTTADAVDGWDSINHVKLILTLEGDLGVQFLPEEVDDLHLVGDLVSLIQKKVGSG